MCNALNVLETTRVASMGNMPMAVATRFVNVIKGMKSGASEIQSLSSAFLFCFALVDNESFYMYKYLQILQYSSFD